CGTSAQKLRRASTPAQDQRTGVESLKTIRSCRAITCAHDGFLAGIPQFLATCRSRMGQVELVAAARLRYGDFAHGPGRSLQRMHHRNSKSLTRRSTQAI